MGLDGRGMTKFNFKLEQILVTLLVNFVVLTSLVSCLVFMVRDIFRFDDVIYEVHTVH